MHKMLSEVKNLYDNGFAIHLLKRKSKHPIDSAWTTGSRKKWKEIEKRFKPGMNIGVRLGSPSVVDGGYLAVIDIDNKSEDPRHAEEVAKKLHELFPELADKGLLTPTVLSGRGNGSSHIYILTPEPIRSKRLSQSNESVKVKMPSASPTKREREELSDNELSNGIKLRAAWEISLMGEGQQVVLPPSIHPDSGKEYKWGCEFNAEATKFYRPDLTKLVGENRDRGDIIEITPFTEEEVSLEKLTDADQELIIEGAGSQDRSAEIFRMMLKMLRVGYSYNQILNVFSDQFNYLGQCAYDHTKSGSRARAVRWLSDHSLTKAIATLDAKKDFDAEVEVKELGVEAAEKQEAELVKYGDWRDGFQRAGKGGKGPIKPNYFNTRLVLTNSFSEPLLRRNEFSYRNTYNVKPPWGGRRGDELRDIDLIHIKDWMVTQFNFEVPTSLVDEVISKIAAGNSFHPVREYLGKLEWDGVSRINTWLKVYLNAEGEEPYLSAVSRKFLCATVARVMQPGVKFDHILILEGKQGIGKSSASRILASEKWFCDNLPDIRDKDSRLNLVGAWIVEVGELATLKRADSEAYKAFFSAQQDRVRAPYGRKFEDTPRQCTFIGTTNNDDYLRDRTGNRRFWPVVVHGCKFKELERDRDQLFAEALATWEFGEELWLDAEENKVAEEVQESKVAEDIYSMMEQKFLQFLDQQKTEKEEEKFDFSKFQAKDLFEGLGAGVSQPFSGIRMDNWNLQTANRILKIHGFEKFKSNGTRYFRKTGSGGGKNS